MVGLVSTRRRTAALSIAVAAAASASWPGAAGAATKTYTGTTAANWDLGDSWAPAGEPTAADDALFPSPIPATGATVALTAGELANSLTFREAYTLNGGNLTLSAGGNVTVAPTFTATINSTLIGGNGLTLRSANGLTTPDDQVGGGTLVVTGTNTFTGAVAVQLGTLSFGNLTNLNLASATNTLSLGTATTAGTLNYTGNTASIARTVALGSLAGGQTINVATAGQTLTISGVISGGTGNATAVATLGNASLNVTGPGRLELTGTNTFTGNIVVDGGTLAASNTDARLGGTAAGQFKSVILQNGGTYNLTTGTYNPSDGSGTNTANKRFVIGAGGGTLDLASGATLQLDDANQFSGTGTLTKNGAGTLFLNSQAFTYTGAAVNINAGTLRSGNASSLGTGSPTINVANAASFDVTAVLSGTKPIVVAGSGANATNGAITTTTGAGTANGPVTLNGNATLGGAGNLTLSGAVSDGAGTFNVTKVGGGFLALTNAANDWGGSTTVAGGALRGAIGSNIPATSNIVLNGGAYEAPAATLAATLGTGGGQFDMSAGAGGFSAAVAAVDVTVNGGAQLVWGTTANFSPASLILGQPTAAGTTTLTNAIDLNGTTRTFAGNSTQGGTVAGIVSNGGATPAGVTVNGTGVLVLSNTNTYDGTTTLTAGTLSIGSLANLGQATTPVVFDGGTLRVTGTTVNGLGTHTPTFNATKTVAFDIVDASNTFTVSQPLNQTTGGLTKTGAGTLVLGATGTYTGQTTITGGGTIRLAANDGIGPTSTVLIGNNAATTGNLDLDGFDQTIAGLTVSSNTATANTFTVEPGNTLTINGNVTFGNTVSTGGGGQTVANFVGGGALSVASTGGTFELGRNIGTTNNSARATVNLSALSDVSINVGSGGNVTIQPNGDNQNAVVSTLRLSDTANTIFAGTTTVGASSTGAAQVLRLGAGGTNLLRTNTLNVGTGGRDGGTVQFDAAGAGTFNIRDFAGTGAAVLNVATGTANTGVGVNNLIDLRGHSVDLLLGAVTVGTQPRSANQTNTIQFDAGTVTMASLVLSAKGAGGSTTNGTTAGRTTTSTLDVGGGTLAITGGATLGDTQSSSGNVGTFLTTSNGTVNVTGGAAVTLGNASGPALRMGGAVANTLGNGTLNITGGSVALTGDIALIGGAGTTTATVTVDGGTLNMGGFNIGSATGSVVLNARSGVLANVAAINGTGGLTKTTAGTLLMNGTNAYAGPTVVQAGTLGGTGTIANAVSVDPGATLAPGASPGVLGTGDVTLAGGSTFAIEIAGAAVGIGYDQLNVTGTVTLGGATLALFDTFQPAIGQQFVIVNNDAADAVSGTFAGLADEAIVIGQFNQFRISYDGPTSGDNDVVLTALTSQPVPEPAALGLLALAGLGLTGRRRRRAPR